MSPTGKDESPTALRVLLEYPLRRGQLVLALQGDPPDWVEAVLKGLGQLVLAPPARDREARPVDPACAWAAWRLLSGIMWDDSLPPTLDATRGGGVLIEWHTRGIDLVIEVADPHRVLASYANSGTGERWQTDVADDPGVLASHVVRLRGPG